MNATLSTLADELNQAGTLSTPERNLSVSVSVRMSPQAIAQVKSLSKAIRVSESTIYRAAVQQKVKEWAQVGRITFPITPATA